MSSRLQIGIISAGKVGCSLGSALRAIGHEITGAYARSPESCERLDAMLPGVPSMGLEEIIKASQCVLLALPDDELPGILSGVAELGLWRPGQLVFHVAGRFGTRVLEPAARAGALTLALHPAMTFTGTSLDVARLVGCPFAVTASPLLAPIGQALVTELGGVPVRVEEENRALYHASLAHGANHLVVLVAQAQRMLEAAGVENPGMYVRPLFEAALEGALSSGEALATGPVMRADTGTVAEHLAAIDALAATDPSARDIPPTYRQLAQAATERAHVRRVLNDVQADELRTLLGCTARTESEEGEE